MTHSGDFHGRVTHIRTFGRVRVSESQYAGHTRLGAHAHRAAFLSFVVDGCYTETVARRALTCHANVLRYHPLGEEHADTFDGRGGTCLNVELTEELLDGVGRPFSARPYSIDSMAHPALLVRRELRRPDRASALVVEEIAAQVLERCREEFHRRARVADSEPVRRAVEYIEAHVTDRLTLADVAAAAGVHETHLARAFRQRTGMTAGEYARRRRITRAERRMRVEPTVSSSAIAAELGFADHAHFSRTFRRVVGITPTAYRRICNS